MLSNYLSKSWQLFTGDIHHSQTQRYYQLKYKSFGIITCRLEYCKRDFIIKGANLN